MCSHQVPNGFPMCGLAIVHKRKERTKEGDRKVEAFSKSHFLLTTSTIATSDSFFLDMASFAKNKTPKNTPCSIRT